MVVVQVVFVVVVLAWFIAVFVVLLRIHLGCP
jgi:hypothetical protein